MLKRSKERRRKLKKNKELQRAITTEEDTKSGLRRVKEKRLKKSTSLKVIKSTMLIIHIRTHAAAFFEMMESIF